MPQPREEWSDQQLIDAVQQSGDDRAFEVLYLRHRDWSMRTAARFVGNHEHAGDIVHDTFIWLLKRCGQPTPLRLHAQLRTILYAAIQNAVIDAGRRAATRTRYNQSFAQHQAAQFLADTAEQDADRLGALHDAMSQLSDDHREVVILRFVDDLSLAEIAAALEIPLGTVKTRLHYALRSLRSGQALKDEASDDSKGD